MQAPKVTAISETHRGSAHLVTCTFELDITQAPRLIDSFDVSDIAEPQLDHLLDTADAVAKARKLEADAAEKRAAKFSAEAEAAAEFAAKPAETPAE